MRRFLTETTAATSPTDRVLTSPAPRPAAPEENEHEMRNCHTFGHDIERRNRCGCARRKRAWSSKLAHHRFATADNWADASLAEAAAAAAFAARARTTANGEIAAPRRLRVPTAGDAAVQLTHIEGNDFRGRLRRPPGRGAAPQTSLSLWAAAPGHGFLPPDELGCARLHTIFRRRSPSSAPV